MVFLNAIVLSVSHGEVPSHRRSAFPSISQEFTRTANRKSATPVTVHCPTVKCQMPHGTTTTVQYLRLSATPGSEETVSRDAPTRRVVHRRLFFRRQVIGLLCGKGVEPPRGRGRPGGGRESQVFFGLLSQNVFKGPRIRHYHYYYRII